MAGGADSLVPLSRRNPESSDANLPGGLPAGVTGFGAGGGTGGEVGFDSGLPGAIVVAGGDGGGGVTGRDGIGGNGESA